MGIYDLHDHLGRLSEYKKSVQKRAGLTGWKVEEILITIEQNFNQQYSFIPLFWYLHD
ncbi:hypothetical protein [Lysinibacillus sphaericus]|uniref:Uncharacterized protein n=1 Tax=Lysinibacillus sphaericus TaxID=1421 RepID=A0A6H0A0G2_LYSSH|nr:hypothetical protein [Lysinibacillus sphaericus]QIS31154.1 hypothetical protein [Lysinibacillus sphaericus]QPA61294.1 hypothetical protein INQ55_23465 [Lysinibacillus sphaericus]